MYCTDVLSAVYRYVISNSYTFYIGGMHFNIVKFSIHRNLGDYLLLVRKSGLVFISIVFNYS